MRRDMERGRRDKRGKIVRELEGGNKRNEKNILEPNKRINMK